MCITTNMCYAECPGKGTFTIPQMKIVYSNAFELIDSIIDNGNSNDSIAYEHDLYINMAKIESGEDYRTDYMLMIWIDRTNGIPWSNKWYAYHNYRGHNIFMNELFANLFTDGEKINYTTFNYSYTDDRKTDSPIYEWHYYINLNFKFDAKKRRPYSIDKEWLERMEDRIIYSKDDIWLKE